MSGEIHVLPNARIPSALPNDVLIDVIRNLLTRAESGELQSFIGVGWTREGHRLATWADFHENIFETLGSLELMRAEYIARRVDRR